jgi:hypothetical protein
MKISYPFPLQSIQVQASRILGYLSRWLKGNDRAAINLMYWVEHPIRSKAQLMFYALAKVAEKTRLQRSSAN